MIKHQLMKVQWDVLFTLLITLALTWVWFYKRRDYSTVVNGKNPIVAHEFLGANIKGKTVIIIDDMISSGESMLDTAKELKDRGAKNVVVCCTFGLFHRRIREVLMISILRVTLIMLSQLT